jgi:hypothetical protein
MAQYSFDTSTFLRERWENHDALLAFFQRYGVDTISRAALFKWYRRDSIPSDWLPVLLALIEIDSGQPVSLIPYLKQ